MVICDVRRTAEVITVIEEGLFFSSIVWNVTITSLWVIRVTRIVPAYRWTRVGIWCGVGAWSLNPTLWHIMVTKFRENSIIANTRVLRVIIRTLFCRYTRRNALLLIVCLLLLLYLIHTLSVVLLTSGYVRAVTPIDVVKQTRSYP